MIVLEDRELVILTPPHTASGNLHRALCSERFGGRWAIGPTPDGAGFDHHTIQISEGWKDFQTVLVVRHPLDRLIGLYEHHQEISKQSGWDLIPWWLFVAQVLERHPDVSWFYRTTIVDLVGDVKIDQVIRYETLGSDLEKLMGEPVPMFEGWVGARVWSAFYDQIGPCCQAEWWGREDMGRWNYQSKV